ncbi:ankyrin repeat-containing domain protein [Mycena leptocephala]|nr:ankyrin repeat-containing domain protein [Mycena leptocephala]
MAETVGLVASVFQLLETVLKARDFITDFRNAPAELQRLVLEVEQLKPLVRVLNDRTGTTSPVLDNGLDEALLRLEAIMKELKEHLDKARSSEVAHRFAWSWRKKDFEEALGSLERFKTSLIAWLNVHGWQTIPDIQKEITESANEQRRAHREILSRVEEISDEQRLDHGYLLKSNRGIALKQQQSQESAEIDKIFAWLSPQTYCTRQDVIFRDRTPGTGEWLLNHETFIGWKSGSHKVLACYGMPGAGKTTLAAIVLAHLFHISEEENIGVGCVYLNHKETETQSPENLLAGFWRQLAGKILPPSVHKLYNRHYQRRTRPSIDDIQEVLSSTILEYSKVYLIVDALDEYPDDQRGSLLTSLSGLGSKVSIMLTSRPHVKDHEFLFPDMCMLEIRAREDDLRRYLDVEMTKSIRLARNIDKKPELRDEIMEAVVSQSNGMFLLAKFHINSIKAQHTPNAVRKALDALSTDLDRVYRETMDRIDGQPEHDRELARQALLWVTAAKRLLSVSELTEALAVKLGTPAFDTSDLADVDSIMSVCGGLVTVDQTHDVIRLIHPTAHHYLKHHFPDAQTKITEICIACLSYDAFQSSPVIVGGGFNWTEYKRLSPFARYAAQYGLRHAKGPPEFQIGATIHRFLGQASIDQISIPDTKLNIAAFFDLREIAIQLIEGGFQVDGDSLIIASVEGSQDVAHLLIEHGADVNASNVHGSCLVAASQRGCEKMVRLLLEHGADPDAPTDSFHGTPLQVAAACNYTEVVQVLLQSGANVNAVTHRGFRCEPHTALHAAMEAGNFGIFQLLLDNGANICAPTKLLFDAAKYSRNQTIELLFNHGADVNEHPYGPMALQKALEYGHLDTVRLLLNHGANIDADFLFYGPMLHAASREGQKEMVELFVQHGANINLSAGQDGTALRAACLNGHKEIAHFLLDHGAEVNARGHMHHGTALEGAAGVGHKNLVLLLLDNGADKASLGAALQSAAQNGHQEIVLLLLEHGADVNSSEPRHQRALSGAAENGHEGVVRLLLEHGADVNYKWGLEGLTALENASLFGHSGIVGLLLAHGAQGPSEETLIARRNTMNEFRVTGRLTEHFLDHRVS